MEFTKEELLTRANALCKNTLMETLDIEICDVGVDYLVAKMPVSTKVYQPEGVLHGGATVALAESVGSFAAHIFMDTQNLWIRGIEISANHVKSVKEGMIYARATFIHKGRSTQIFDIRITDEKENLVSVCKLTTLALPK